MEDVVAVVAGFLVVVGRVTVVVVVEVGRADRVVVVVAAGLEAVLDGLWVDVDAAGRLVVGFAEEAMVDRLSEVVGALEAAPARDVLLVAADAPDLRLSSPELKTPLVFSSVELLSEARERCAAVAPVPEVVPEVAGFRAVVVAVAGAGRIGGLLRVFPGLERLGAVDDFEAAAADAVVPEPVVRFVAVLLLVVVGRFGGAAVPFCGEATGFLSFVAFGLDFEGLDLDASPSVWLSSAADGTSSPGVCGAAGSGAADSGAAGSGAGTDSSVDAILLLVAT